MYTSLSLKQVKDLAVSAASGLNIDVAKGRYEIGGNFYDYAGATNQAVTASSTNYVQVNSAGSLVINTTGFDSLNIRLAEVVTNGSAVTSITDKRAHLQKGGGTATWKQGVPTGTINSSNVTFTLPDTPDSNSLLLILDGMALDPGAGDDYTLSADTITFTTAPATGSKLVYMYTKSVPVVSTTSGGYIMEEITGTSKSAQVGYKYIPNNGSLVTITLPASSGLGDTIKVVGLGAGGWKVAQNSGQIIHWGNLESTTGTGGYLASQIRYDCVVLECIVANTEWSVASYNSPLTII